MKTLTLKTRPPKSPPENCGSGSGECTDFFLRITETMEAIREEQRTLRRSVLAMEGRLATLEVQGQKLGHQIRQSDMISRQAPIMQERAVEKLPPRSGAPFIGIVIGVSIVVVIVLSAWIWLFNGF